MITLATTHVPAATLLYGSQDMQVAHGTRLRIHTVGDRQEDVFLDGPPTKKKIWSVRVSLTITETEAT